MAKKARKRASSLKNPEKMVFFVDAEARSYIEAVLLKIRASLPENLGLWEQAGACLVVLAKTYLLYCDTQAKKANKNDNSDEIKSDPNSLQH